MERRDFIQEIIDKLRKRADEIEIEYAKLKAKEITVEQFEEDYRDSVHDVFEDCETEYYSPNNHCTYVLNDGSEVMSNDYNED